jgi:hypothetical protein
LKELLQMYIDLAVGTEDRDAREKLVDGYLNAMIVSAGLQFELQAKQLVAHMKEASTLELVQTETPAVAE